MKRNTMNTTNLKTVDVAIVGGRWSGLAMAKEITTRSGLNVVWRKSCGLICNC